MCCYLRQCVSEREIKTAISERTAGEGSWIQGLSLFSSFSLQINIHEQSGPDLFCISWGEYYAAIINGLIVYKLKIGSFCNSVIPAFFMFLAKENWFLWIVLDPGIYLMFLYWLALSEWQNRAITTNNTMLQKQLIII